MNARPRAERDFLAGDFVCYWRTRKYQRGIRLVGARWYGAGIFMGKVGRNILVYHRRNMFKVSPEHLRHATLEERAVAQSDGRDLLGIAGLVDEQGHLKGSQYVDLSQQELPPSPDSVPAVPESQSNAAEIDAAPQPSRHVSMPSVGNAAEGLSAEASGEPSMGSQPAAAEMSQASANAPNTDDVRTEPFPAAAPKSQSTVPKSSQYGPIRFTHTTKKPGVLIRPPEMIQSDFAEAVADHSSEKRASSRTPSCEAPTKVSRTEAMAATVKTVETIEVFLANFLRKKMQTELHHSNNPPEIQEAIDESKLVEWLTLQDEKRAIRVLDPREAALVRRRKPDRIMSGRFVITQEHEDGNTRMKSRWCLRGHHDPDLMEKVAAGKCQSPTLAQMSKNILLQVLVSFQWEMNLCDIKGAFLEADAKSQFEAKPVYAELPPGGAPGILERTAT